MAKDPDSVRRSVVSSDSSTKVSSEADYIVIPGTAFSP